MNNLGSALYIVDSSFIGFPKSFIIQTEESGVNYENKTYTKLTGEKKLSLIERFGFALRVLVEVLSIIPLLVDLKQIAICWKRAISGVDQRVYLISQSSNITTPTLGALTGTTKPTKGSLFLESEILERNEGNSDYTINGTNAPFIVKGLKVGKRYILKQQTGLSPDAAVALMMILGNLIPESVDALQLSHLDLNGDARLIKNFFEKHCFSLATLSTCNPRHGLEGPINTVDWRHSQGTVDLLYLAARSSIGYLGSSILSIGGTFVIIDDIKSDQVWLRDPFQGAIKVSLETLVSKFKVSEQMTLLYSSTQKRKYALAIFAY